MKLYSSCAFYKPREAKHKKQRFTQGTAGSPQCTTALKLRFLFLGQPAVPWGQPGSQEQSPGQPSPNCPASPSPEASPAVPSDLSPLQPWLEAKGIQFPLLKSTLSLMVMSTLIYQENVKLLGAAFYSWSVFSLSLSFRLIYLITCNALQPC